VAVISAYEPEWKILKAGIGEEKSHYANGVEFVTGTLAGRQVVLFLSGVSMVNAAMTSQLALDRLDVTGIVGSGIAGGVDPGLGMESAAVAMVAYANNVPFIAFRSLSDLAGGGEGANELRTFFQLASDNSAAVVQRFLALWTPPR